MNRASRLLAVQLAPVLALSRFVAIGAHDLLAGNDFAFLKTYALALGLVAPFVAAAGLRARIVLMSNATSQADYPPMQRLLVVGSVAGLAGSAFIVLGTAYVVIGLLIAGTKTTDNLVESHLAALQRRGDRDSAINLQLWRNAWVLLAYSSLFMFHSLELTLLIELVVGSLGVIGFAKALRQSRVDRHRYMPVLKASAAISGAAFFNGFMITLVIRRLVEASFVSTAEGIGLIAAMFTISGRVLGNNSVFYRKRIEDLLTRASRSHWIYVLLAALVLTMVAVNLAYVGSERTHQTPVVICLVLILLALNAYSLLVRVSLLMRRKAVLVIALHVIECLSVVAFFVPTADIVFVIDVLILSRVLRTAVFAFQHRERVGEAALYTS